MRHKVVLEKEETFYDHIHNKTRFGKTRRSKTNVHLVFLDLRKSFDTRISQKEIWNRLKNKININP